MTKIHKIALLKVVASNWKSWEVNWKKIANTPLVLKNSSDYAEFFEQLKTIALDILIADWAQNNGTKQGELYSTDSTMLVNL